MINYGQWWSLMINLIQFWTNFQQIFDRCSNMFGQVWGKFWVTPKHLSDVVRFVLDICLIICLTCSEISRHCSDIFRIICRTCSDIVRTFSGSFFRYVPTCFGHFPDHVSDICCYSLAAYAFDLRFEDSHFGNLRFVVHRSPTSLAFCHQSFAASSGKSWSAHRPSKPSSSQCMG